MLPEIVRSLKSLARSPRFSLTVVVTLALAIGGAGGLFSLLEAVVLRPLPIRDPARLVAVFPANGEALFGVSMPTLAAMTESQRALTNICGTVQGSAITVEVNGAHALRPTEAITGGCTDTLGLEPAIGQLIGPAEAPLNGASAEVATISHRFWQEAYNGAPDVIGRQLRVSGQPLTIIGVLPETYRGLNADEAPDVVLPLDTMWRMRGGRVLALHLVGRLRDDVSLTAAREQLRAAWVSAWQATNPAGLPLAATRAGLAENLHVESLEHGFSPLRNRFAKPLIAAVSLAALLVVLAAFNVGALLLSRAVAREQQLAVQLALGASRGRIALSAWIEGAALALCAAIASVPIAWGVARVVAATAWTTNRPLTMTVTPAGSTLAVIGATALVAGALAGLGPAVVVLMGNVRLTGSRSALGVTRWWRRGLVTAQIALSFALLFCAALFVVNLAGVRGRDLGYAADGIRWSRLELVLGAPRAYDLDSYARTLIDRLAGLPGVESVAMSVGFPTTEVRHTTARFPIERTDRPSNNTAVSGMMDRVSPGFFRTIGAPLLRGREFDWNDTARSIPVAIITKPLAEQLFPDGDALGSQIRIPNRKPQDLTVVGVARDFSPGDPRIHGIAHVYVPMMQEPAASSLPAVLLRTQHDAGLLASAQESVASLGRHELPVLRTISYQTERLLTQERLLSSLATAFGLLGMMVGGMGLYALLAQSVLTRTREIGVRMAVGATQSAIVTLVTKESAWLVLTGAIVGIPLAVASGVAARTLLFEMSPFSPVAIMMAIGLILLMAAVAAAIPAGRAARTDPAVCLRAD